MEPIRMVDLKGQYTFIAAEVKAALDEVIESTAFINGPAVKEFQANLEEYLGVKYVIPCANGTDALQIALMGLKLEPGDEIITTDFTFAATVEVISLLRLKPVLVDVDPKTFNIDPKAVEAAITPKTNTRPIKPLSQGLASNTGKTRGSARMAPAKDNAKTTSIRAT